MNNFCGVPLALSGYANAANFPSGDQLSALMVKFKAKGAEIFSNGGQAALSEMHAAETRANSMPPPPWRGCKKKYNSPDSVALAVDSGSSGAGVESAAGAESGAGAGVSAEGVIASKKETGVGVEQAERVKIKNRMKMRFMRFSYHK